MVTPLIPQEIYLLERFCSLERYGDMRDAWQAMISHVENMLERFMQDLPKDYRKRPPTGTARHRLGRADYPPISERSWPI